MEVENWERYERTGNSMGIKAGDVVCFKPEWQDRGDDRKVFRAVEDEDRGRVKVVCELGLPINPTQVVQVAMVDDLASRVATAMDLMACADRERLIAWLVANDRDGVYSDADCEAEGYDPMTVESARKQIGRELGRDDELVAELFRRQMRENCSLTELAEIDQRNRDEKDSRICHSHDFCDANQAMIDAFGLLGIDADEAARDYEDEMDAAWDRVKRDGFAKGGAA